MSEKRRLIALAIENSKNELYKVNKNMNEKRYENYQNLKKALVDYDESNLSHGEILVYNALQGLSKNYAWRMYLALYDLIDSWLY